MPRLRSTGFAVATALSLASGALLAVGADAQTMMLPQGAGEAAKAITPAAIDGAIQFLADDLLEGRGPASRGDELTQLYLATQMRQLGLEPGAENGQWEQKVDIVGIDTTAPAAWNFQGKGSSLSLAWMNDYVGSSGVETPTAEIQNAEVVFVGYGIQAPEYGWDDFKGMDLKGKVLLMLNNDPDWDPKLFEGKKRLYYGRWVYKYESAARQGAAGAIIVHTTPSAAYPFQVVQTSWSGPQFSLPNDGQPTLRFKSWATEEASKKLAALGGQDLARLIESAKSKDFKPVPLGVTTSIAVTNKVEHVKTANVLGLLRGSDPELSKDVVVISAHHDHLGRGKAAADGDDIYNGAVDNASGSAQVLAIARAMTSLPQRPRRSILFAFVAAEEQGLLGSAYYARHPTFAPGRIAANVNLDAGNRWGRTKDVTYIGYGKSSLDKVIEAAAAMQGRTVKGDQNPDRGSFYRSDQFNFAKIGVPALYIDGGEEYTGADAEAHHTKSQAYVATDYHQASDEWGPDWNYDGMVEDTLIAYYSALAIATDPVRPTWNKGDEFEATRLKALSAVK
jgi:Zn-dependent M28 family amino/carboxypeptidase